MAEWTEPEIAWLKENASRVTVYEAAEHLKRSYGSVYRYAWSNNIKFKGKVRTICGHAAEYKKWTDEEKKYVLNNLADLPIEEIAAKLDRSIHTVKEFARKSGKTWLSQKYRAYSEREKNLILYMAATHDAEYIAKQLKRTARGIEFYCSRNNIKLREELISLKQACRDTGYNVKQLLRAREGLQQTWKRNQRRFFISETQLEALCDYLRDEGRPQQEAA